MNSDKLDPKSLLIPEMVALLAEAGVQVDLRLTDAQGGPLDAELTQSLRAATEVYNQQRDFERRLVDLGELGAGVTHEARNVIAGVVGLAQLSLSKRQAALASAEPAAVPERSDDGRALETIARESARCVGLLNNYLSFASRTEPSAQLVSVLSLVDPVIQLTAHEAKVRRCTIDVHIEPNLPAIVVRASEIREVLLNLVLNALHVTQNGGVIELRADRAEKDFLRIVVSDDGPGVPESIRARIFEKFYSTKPAGMGTGIGLAVARGAVSSHGGSIDVQDSKQGGAEFVVLLPMQQDVYTISERARVKR